ncbi:short-chain dehydrogenase [Coraliomargarita sinensis]|uniref:Short-chain dehydrogenase n=1 Tax=Coraliomargarita sinensis TaxID=2174842 RepID=A0A317ZGI7_9BACT|nr:SDR family oxidoreductase [Coraliomargarita sinensis]PXA04550.1 short-chain dehydrogenase [Coraliomargarita sinensis]
MTSSSLNNRSIVIIGGTTGLGLSAAKAFLREGASVIAVGRNPESVAHANEAFEAISPDQGKALAGDAIHPQTAKAAIQTCLDNFDSFHGLYHVAGGSGRRFGDGPLHEITEEGIDKTLNLNLKSLILSNRAAVQAFLKRDTAGTVLNMGSVLGYSPSPRYFSTHVYAAAKAAIIGFTKSTAAYYADKNIRLNVIAPALVETPMAQRAAQDETIQAFVKSKQPLDGGRIGSPEDLDGLATYLLSEESRFVTGQVIAVDGGWTVSEGQY